MDVSVVRRQADDTVELGCRPCSERPEAWLLDVLSGPAGSVAVLNVRIEDGGSQLVWQSLAECAAVGSGTGAADDPLDVLVTIPAVGSVAWEVRGLPGPVAIVGVARAEATAAEEPAHAAGRLLEPQARAESAPQVAAIAERQDASDGTPTDVSPAHDRALRLLWQASSGETPAARVALLAEALRCWPENQSIQRRLAEAQRNATIVAPPLAQRGAGNAARHAAGDAREHLPNVPVEDAATAHDQALRLLWRASQAETPAARVALLAQALRWWPENESIKRRLAVAKRRATVAAPSPALPRAASALTGEITPVAGRPVRRRTSRGGPRTWNSGRWWIVAIILLLIVAAAFAVIAWREMTGAIAPQAARPELPAMAAVADEWAAARDGGRGARPWCAAGTRGGRGPGLVSVGRAASPIAEPAGVLT